MTAVPRPRNEPPLSRCLEQPDPGPTVLRMILGARLRGLRQERGVSREDAGRAIRASHAKISRLELGQVGFREIDLVDLLDLYGVSDEEERSAYLELARRANAPGWWHRYNDVVEKWFDRHLGLEPAASLIRTYQVQFLPGMLQTEEYAHVVTRLGYPHAPRRKIDRLVELRMERQKLLTREQPPQLWAVVDESTLRRPMGGPSVMRRQLEHLLAVVDELRHVSLQVALFSAGVNAVTNTPITILRLREPAFQEIVYLEQLTSALYLDKPDEVEQYKWVMDRLVTAAEPRQRTPELVRGILSGRG